MIQILQFQEKHLESVLDLTVEFGEYLGSLSHVDRGEHSREVYQDRYLRYAFSSEKAFSGYVAEIDGEILGYAMYHYGFDPDEMQGKVIYLIDLFVSERARGRGVGRALIEKLQSHPDSLGLYFGVWRKNIGAIDFYKKLGADWIEDVPFMKLMK